MNVFARGGPNLPIPTPLSLFFCPSLVFIGFSSLYKTLASFRLFVDGFDGVLIVGDVPVLLILVTV